MVLWIDTEEANNIPIKLVASLVVTGFQSKGNYSTGKCCKHVDNNLGNFRLRNENLSYGGKNNYAHCFTCGETWGAVSLVMDYKGLDFVEAKKYLYENFPSYFTNVTTEDMRPKWNGLNNSDYTYLGIPIQHMFGSISMNIREFARNYPEEHDFILMDRVISFYKKVEAIEKQIVRFELDKDKMLKDKSAIENKLLLLLKKGLFSSKGKSLCIERIPERNLF